LKYYQAMDGSDRTPSTPITEPTSLIWGSEEIILAAPDEARGHRDGSARRPIAAVHRLVVLEHGQKSPWLTESSNIGGCEVVGDGSAVEIDQSLPVIAQQRSGHSFRVVLDRPHIA